MMVAWGASPRCVVAGCTVQEKLFIDEEILVGIFFARRGRVTPLARFVLNIRLLRSLLRSEKRWLE